VAFGRNDVRNVKLLYRQADQSQRWRAEEMQSLDRQFRGTIPAEYTQSPYPCCIISTYKKWAKDNLSGFQSDLSNQPYFLVRSDRGEDDGRRSGFIGKTVRSSCPPVTKVKDFQSRYQREDRSRWRCAADFRKQVFRLGAFPYRRTPFMREHILPCYRLTAT